MQERFHLRPAQLEAIEWMKAREATPPYGGILADNVGAGKTYTIAGLLKHSPLWPVLILVPKSLIWQWVSVIDEACLDEELHVVPKASKKIDEVMGKDKNKLIVATHGCLLDPPKEMTSRSWGRIIVDEAHCAKNSKSITSRSLRKLRAHAKWAITATPVQNCRDDLLAIAGALGITSQDTNFVREVFVGRASHASHASHASLELPPLFVKVIEVPLTGDLEVKAYQDATKLLAKVDDSSSSNMCRMAFLRCRQAATHPCLFYESMANSMNESSHSLSLDLRLEAQRARDLPVAKASSKIGYLVKDVLAHPDEAAVVFCEWSSEMGLVIDALRSAGANAFSYNGKLSVQERQDVLTTFRKCAKPAVLVAQIKCASAGLNIQCASRAYIMRPQWNPATERQVVGRLHRSGQEREVHVMRLVAKFEGHKTVDELTLNKQQGKLRCITEVMKDDEMERVLGKIGFDLALV